MKLTPVTILLLSLAFPAMASDLPADGYYRVENFMSHRYVYVLDNHGTIDIGATSADLKAIELWKVLDNAISDPATVLDFTHIQDREYDVTSQGTGIHNIIDYYVRVRAVNSQPDTYLLYATNSGMTKYLCDGERNESLPEGVLSDNGEGKWRYWHLDRIAADSDNYFGIAPDLKAADGSYYAPFYAGFPFSFSSPGMTAYYVSKVDTQNAIAVISEISGAVPAATPVLIKCGSSLPSANRLSLGGNPSVQISGNCLKGVYFQSDKHLHYNMTAYNSATMRIPAILPDGKPGFVTSDIKYLPRNKSYLTVPEGSPATLRAMTEKEYDTWLQNRPPAGIESVTADENVHDIYNIFGIKVSDTSRHDDLTPGIYIINGRKVIINNR